MAQRGGDLTRAGELTYGVIPDLEKRILSRGGEGSEQGSIVKEK